MNSYAKALMEIAIANNTLEQISYQFDELNEAVFSNRKWLDVMNSPMLDDEQKIKNIDQLDLNQHLATMLKMLATSKQMDLYDHIYPEWVRMIREKNNVAHINVYTVKELTKEQIEALSKKLQPRFKNQTIEIHVKVRDNLIGGIRMVHEGQSLDHSIARELEELFMTL
ncbi:MAG: ATP synthase F1 subunit delta [Acholeplasmataceae bacterium]